jgi:uncharacterized surface protein with fasciclin (FAS1) repeats
MTPIRPLAAALALVAIVPLGGCSKADDGEATSQAEGGTVDRTLAAAIADAPQLSHVASALSNAGLAGVFDGPGSYTVLAPDDDAFASFGDGEQELTSAEERPVMVAVLRDHILPGHLTVDAIRKAIEAKGGPVEMRTLGEGTVEFSLAGDDIAVTSDDGMKAKVDGAELAASNGAVIPIDGLLKAPRPVG